MSSEDLAIQVDNVSKCYTLYNSPRDRLKQFLLPRFQRALGLPRQNYYREFWALKNVSLAISKGETVGIIGRNGSGKSTLLQLICGTLFPSEGRIVTHGTIAALLELGSGFNPEFSGRENVFMNATILGLRPEQIRACYDDIVAFADIGHFIDQPVKTYSSGMVVRLAFAVSVMVNPDILVVDEALAVGDAGFQFKCLERIKRLKERGTTVLFVSHSMDMVKAFCDHVIFLKDGQIIASGSPEDMAEIYIMDVRSEQIKSAPETNQLKIKTSLGKGVAFGTDQGNIIGAGFADENVDIHAVSFGETIRLWADLKLDQSIEKPALSLLVQDRRLIPIAGKRIPLPARCGEARVDFSFPAAFSEGTYFITLRLEDHSSSIDSTDFSVLEKQAGILSFEVIHTTPRTFLGLVDFDITGRAC